MVAGHRSSRVTERAHVGAALLSALFALSVISTSAHASPPEVLNFRALDQGVDSSGVRRSFQNEHVLPSELLGEPANQRRQPPVSRAYPLPSLEPVTLTVSADDQTVGLSALPQFLTEFGGKVAGVTPRNQIVFYSIDPDLQHFSEGLVKASKSPHVAIVAMEPRSGRILAIAQRSSAIPMIALHTGFPAASLFKVVTAAAAVEQASLDSDTLIRFRGGTYTLERWNYRPDARRDRKALSLGQALGMSCNPVFGRVALNFLSAPVLERYARLFGFNSSLEFDAPLPVSSAVIPRDEYELSRTAAGFGEVRMSPVHAAAFMSGVANGGLLPRPILIDRIVNQDGAVLYENRSQVLKRIVQPETARELMEMMHYTTTVGTSRNEFMRKRKPIHPQLPVSAKTGTLKGEDPAGLNTWFIAAAPMADPEIAIAVIVVNPMAGTKAAKLGRQVMERFFRGRYVMPAVSEPAIHAPPKAKKTYPKKKPVVAKKAKKPAARAPVKAPVKLKPAKQK